MRRDQRGAGAAAKRVVLAALVSAAMVGCHRRVIVPTDIAPPPVENAAPVPTYGELVDRYNANLNRLDRLWAGTTVKVAWRDADGDSHFHDGEGKLIFVPPRRVAMTVDKVGKNLLWAGADDERFWLFDRQEDTAYVGLHRNVGKPCVKAMPLPVRATSVPHLLGLMRLEHASGGDPEVEQVEGYYRIVPPGLDVAMLLDPGTARPVQVDLLNDAGEAVATSRLKDHQRVQIDGVPILEQPVVPGKADLYVAGQEARLTLVFDRASVSEDRIQARLFDFDALTKAMKPKQVVRVDADCD